MLRVSSKKKQPQRAHCDGENSPTSMPLTIVSYSDRVGGSSMSSPHCMLHCHHVCLLGRRKLSGKRKCQKWPRLLKGQLTMLTCSNSCLTYRKGVAGRHERKPIHHGSTSLCSFGEKNQNKFIQMHILLTVHSALYGSVFSDGVHTEYTPKNQTDFH